MQFYKTEIYIYIYIHQSYSALADVDQLLNLIGFYGQVLCTHRYSIESKGIDEI